MLIPSTVSEVAAPGKKSSSKNLPVFTAFVVEIKQKTLKELISEMVDGFWLLC